MDKSIERDSIDLEIAKFLRCLNLDLIDISYVLDQMTHGKALGSALYELLRAIDSNQEVSDDNPKS